MSPVLALHAKELGVRRRYRDPVIRPRPGDGAGQADWARASGVDGPVVTELLRHLLTAGAPEAAAAFGVAAVRDATGVEVSWCGLVRDNVLTMAAHSGLRTVRMANEWTLPVGVGVGGRVAADGKPLWVRDYRHDPRRAPERKTMIDDEGIRAAMCAPLTAGGQVLGVLYAARRTTYDWSAEEVALLTELATDCGAAIGRLRRRGGPFGGSHDGADLSVLQATLDLQSDLAEVLVASGDLAAGLAVLTRRLGLSVDVVDSDGRSLLAQSPSSAPVRYRIALPGASGEHLEIMGKRDLSPEEQTAATAAATVLSMQLRVVRAGAAAQQRAARDLLNALITGGGDPALVRSDAALLGLDLRQSHHVVCVGTHRGNPVAAEAAPLSGAAVEQLGRALTAACPGSLVVAREGDLVVVLPSRSGTKPQERIRDLIRARTLPAEGLAAGLGRRCSTLRDFVESFGEASLALDLARRQPEVGTVFTAADLGLSGLLAAGGSSRKTLEAMVESTLGPLLASDARGGTDHIRTLRTWLAHDRHLERTAETLHVHPNTVRYRLGRARELLGLDLRIVEDRFQIDLALRVLEALEGTTARMPEPRGRG